MVSCKVSTVHNNSTKYLLPSEVSMHMEGWTLCNNVNDVIVINCSNVMADEGQRECQVVVNQESSWNKESR